jgi:tetratricopeptide (TPR) repeat protein
LPNVEKSIRKLLLTGILKKKKAKDTILEFLSQDLQSALENLTDKDDHTKAIKYYEKKKKTSVFDEIEILYHKASLNPSEELVNEFLAIANSIVQFEYGHKRLINVAQELFVLEDKHKAPILIVLGNLFSVIGDSEDAEKIFLNALTIYRKLAKDYYKIYLPYIAATQKNLGSLYIDLKRFEDAEKIYNEALNSYKDLEKQYYDGHSPDFHLKGIDINEKSYIDDLKAYNELLRRYYDIHLPEEPPVSSDYGNVGIDLELLKSIKDGSIGSMDTYKTLAKVYYDMYLIDIAKTHSSLGLIYHELMRFEDAEQMHLEALKIKRKIVEHYPDQVLPELVLTLLDLGDLYASLNKFEEAEPLFNEALLISKRLAEQNPEVYFHNVALIQNSLGRVYTRLQKYEEAEESYVEALEIFKNLSHKDPKAYSFNIADVQNNFGNLFLTLRNLEKAGLYLNKAFKKDPSNIDILYNLACLEALKNNKLKAVELLSEVIKVDKDYIKRAEKDKKFEKLKDMKAFKELING